MAKIVTMSSRGKSFPLGELRWTVRAPLEWSDDQGEAAAEKLMEIEAKVEGAILTLLDEHLSECALERRIEP